MSSGNIRRAVATDASVVSAIAQAAKRHWGYPEQWLQLWHPELTLDAAQIAALEVYVIEAGGDVAGFYALVPGAPRWTLEDPNAESFYQHLGGRRVGEVQAPVPGAAERRLPLLVLDEIIP